MEKSADAFRTISEVADDLSLPQHVLRFWETRFPQIRPLKRAGGRRYYRPADVLLLRSIRQLLYDDGYTIKGVQRLLKEQGAKGRGAGPRLAEPAEPPPDDAFETGDESDHDHDKGSDKTRGAGEAAGVERQDEPGADAVQHLTSRELIEEALATVEHCTHLLDAVLRPPSG